MNVGPAQGQRKGLAVLCAVAFAERLFIWSWTVPLVLLFLLESGRAVELRGVLTALAGRVSAEELPYKLFGAYHLGLYGAVLLGGAIADRLLGHKSALLVGCFVASLGYLFIGFSAPLWVGLLGLGAGMGLLRASIPTLIHRQYRLSDPQRTRGFYFHYASLQVGIFLSPIVSGGISQRAGWAVTFGTAAIVLLVAGAFVWFQRDVLDAKPPESTTTTPRAEAIGALLVLTLIFMGTEIIQYDLGVRWLDGQLDRHLFGASFAVPSEWLQQIPINCGTLLIAFPWVLAVQHRFNPRWQFLAAFVLLGLSMVALAPIPLLSRDGATLPTAWWLVLSTALMSLGELLFLPWCLALLTRQAPSSWMATVVAVWLIVRDYLCDHFAKLFHRLTAPLPLELALTLMFFACILAGLAAQRRSLFLRPAEHG